MIGTGSAGNSYILTDEAGNALILDAGMRVQDIMKGINGNDNVCGCLITHEHNDHSRAIFDLALRGIRVGMSRGTMDAIGAGRTLNVEVLAERQTYVYGAYKIMPFIVQHDAAEPFGFIVEHIASGEKLLYATDTYYLRYTFPNVTYWMIECNYVDERLNETLPNAEDVTLRHRLMTSHMSLNRLKQTLAANDLNGVLMIILIHISESRGNDEMMVTEIERLTGIETVAPLAGDVIDLGVLPF